MERQHIILIGFHAAVLAAGSLTSFARVMTDAERPDCLRMCCIALIGGCVAYGLLCGILEYGPNRPQAIPIAAVIGAAGREINDKLVARVASAMLDGAIRVLEAAKGKDP